MLAPGELQSSLYGAYRIARMDPQAMRYFNLTVDGFWSSFGVMIAALPLQLLINYIYLPAPTEGEAQQSFATFLVVNVVLYLLQLVLYPLAILVLSLQINRQHRFAAYIIAWNWSSVLVLIIMVPVVLVTWLGLLPDGLMALIQLLLYAAIVMYAVLVARAGLECPIFVAVAAALFEQVLSLGLDKLIAPSQ